MNPEELQNKIAEYYSKLPKPAQEMFSKMEWLNKLQGITSRYNMTNTQIQTLGTETSLVMLGIIHPDEYERIIVTELAVPRDIAIKIVDDVNQQIIQDWRQILVETHANNAVNLANETYGGGKTLEERFTGLPPEVQEAMGQIGYDDAIEDIANKYNLTIEQMGKLEVTTNKMMLGLTHPEEYASGIGMILGVSSDVATNISNEVNERILKGIRASLIKHSEEIKIKESPEEPVPTPHYPEMVNEMNTKIASEIINTIEGNAPVLEAQALAGVAPVQKTEGSVMSSAGIELVKEEVQKVEPITQNKVTAEVREGEQIGLAKSGINIVASPIKTEENKEVTTNMRDEIMSGIENPPHTSSSIMGQKLSGILVNTTTSTNRTPIPKIIRTGTPDESTPPSSNPPNGGDRYRETV